MAISLNGSPDPKQVGFNGNKFIVEVKFNGVHVGPSFTTIGYKFVPLEHIQELGVDENTYELHLASYKMDDNYKPNLSMTDPFGLESNEIVVGPDNKPYASPLAFVRRVVIDDVIMPMSMENGFKHLYGGLNNVAKVKEKYPFSGVNFNNISVAELDSMEGIFKQCHVDELDLSTGDTSSITDMDEMFSCCSAYHIYVGDNGTVNQVITSQDMFFECLYLHNFQSKWVDKEKAIIDNTYNNGYLEKK